MSRRHSLFGLVLFVAASALVGIPPVPAASAAHSSDRSVPVRSHASRAEPLPTMPGHAPGNPTWPSPASTVVELPSAAGLRGEGAASVGGLPVRVRSLVDESRPGRPAPGPSKVRVEVLDRASAQRVGSPLALRVSRADGGPATAKVNVRIDYNRFRHAYGGAWAARLGLRQVPSCGLSAGAAARGGCVGVPLVADNDFKAGILSADVNLTAVSADGVSILAVTGSGAAASLGTFAKTDLKASYAWNAGTNAGNFTFSYPMKVPPVPGELEPAVALSYASQAVDGQTASENVQSGPIGEGWALSGRGFIESTFRPCSQDQDHSPYWTNATDTCVRLENYQLSWSGASGELVPTGTPNVWRVASDDRSLVELITSGLGGLGTHWRITTPDGTQWYFGRQRLPGWTAGARETKSVLSQHVWSNHTGEPCLNTGSFYNSHCVMPYRWNLDYVVDAHGNSMSYWYERFTNLHGSAGGGWNELSYDRDAVLSRIEYGTRAGNETTATAPAVVEFTNGDRCLADCWNGSTPNYPNWPDSPWDLQCGAPPCQSTDYYGSLKPITGPTYWSSKRLVKVTTKVRTGGGTTYRPVDEWAFGHQFPGGTDVPVLWLASVTRTGFDAAGNSASVPAMTFHGRRDRNRADYDPNASMADPQKYRIDSIDTETGGRIEVSYLPTNEPACTWWSGKSQSEWPNYNHNASRCFMQYVTNRSGVSAWSWWHKFVVDKVTERDMVGGSPAKETSYQYLMDGAASPSTHPLVLWTYSSNPWGTIKKAMNTWRGYPTVITTVGPAGGPQTKTRRLYYRGVDRDTGLDPNQAFFRRATITDSLSATVDDHQALAGRVREEIVYDGATEISKTIHNWSVWQTAGGALPSWQTPPERVAYMSREASTKNLTKVLWDNSWRTTETVNTWDTDWGVLNQTDDQGDTATAADDACTRYTYARNHQHLVYRAGTGAGQVASGTGTYMAGDWSSYDNIFTPGDFNGDGKVDVIARSVLNGNLYLFPGNGAGGFGTRAEIGWGWTDADQIFSPGDFDGDGKSDVLYRRPSDMNLYMVRGNGTGGWIDGASTAVGWGWDGNIIFSPGDITGDGKPDVLYRRPSDQKLYYIRGNGAGGWIDGASVAVDATAWSDRDIIFGRGDVTGDGRTDLYARVAASGELRLYPGNGNGTFAAPVSVGTGWTVYRHLLAAGDINADAQPDIVARFAGARLLGPVRRVERVGVSCSATASYPGDLVADDRISFDDNAYGVPAMRGLATRTQRVKSMNGATVTGDAVTTEGYDPWGRTVRTSDELGRLTTTAYTHNSAGLLASVQTTNPASHITVVNFDGHRTVALTVSDSNGKVTTASYDRLGNLAKVWRPGRSTSDAPDVEYLFTISNTAPSHTLTRTLGPNGNQIASYQIFDGFLRPRQTQKVTENGRRSITDIQYDARGLAAKETPFYNAASAPASTLATFSDVDVDRQTRTVYDGAQRPTFEQVYKNDVKQFERQTRYGGDRIGVIPPSGGTPVQDLFDARGRLVEKRLFSGTPFTGAFDKTTYGYDDADRLTTVTDPAGNQWVARYDLLGRRISLTDPDTGTSTAAYDDAGQMTSTSNASGQALFIDYDSLGRKTTVREGSTSGPVLTDWTYDTYDKGQLAVATRHDGGGLYRIRITDRDDAYRPLHTEVEIPSTSANGALAGLYGHDYTYKANGAPATAVLPAAGGLAAETLTYGYDDNGFAQTLTGTWAGGSQTYIANTDYTHDGKTDTRWLGDAGKQVKLSNQYLAHTGWLAQDSVQIETSPGTFTQKYATDYRYDNAGNITGIGGLTNGVADQYECFRYDHLERLAEAWTQSSYGGGCTTPQRAGADPYWRQWTFDSLGNRLSQVDKDPGAGDTTWTYTVGAAGGVKPHQLKKVDATGPRAGTATRSFAYDATGNTTTSTTVAGAAQTLTWVGDGRLATVTEGSTTTRFVYDADGNRLMVRGSGKTTLYLPDGTELDAPASGGPALGTRYYAGVAVRDATGVKWTSVNHQGTSVVQIDSVTLSASRRRSMPYGEDRTSTPSGWMGTKGYVGGTRDSTGLTHLGAREYDPTLGRFISRDGIMDNADPQQMHGYAYSHNSPVTRSDPSGLIDTCDEQGTSCNGAPTGPDEESTSAHPSSGGKAAGKSSKSGKASGKSGKGTTKAGGSASKPVTGLGGAIVGGAVAGAQSTSNPVITGLGSAIVGGAVAGAYSTPAPPTLLELMSTDPYGHPWCRDNPLSCAEAFRRAAQEYAAAEQQNSDMWTGGGGGGGSGLDLRMSQDELWALHQYWLNVYRAQESAPLSGFLPGQGSVSDPDPTDPDDL
jgi:RHS repeat-associated protein